MQWDLSLHPPGRGQSNTVFSHEVNPSGLWLGKVPLASLETMKLELLSGPQRSWEVISAVPMGSEGILRKGGGSEHPVTRMDGPKVFQTEDLKRVGQGQGTQDAQLENVLVNEKREPRRALL